MTAADRSFQDVRKLAPRIAKSMQRITGDRLRFAVILWDTESTRVCWIHDLATEEILLPRLEGLTQAVRDEIEHRMRGVN